jgi:hypothetical protein
MGFVEGSRSDAWRNFSNTRRGFFVLPGSGKATTFPVAAVGDIFTGSITIDPATPCSSCGNFPGFIYQTFFNAGLIAVNVDGTNFAGNSLYIEVYYDTTPTVPLANGADILRRPILARSLSFLTEPRHLAQFFL